MRELKNKQLLRIITVLILCCIIIWSFIGVEGAEAATKVGLNRSYAVTTKGGTVKLAVKGTSQKVTWRSSDKKIAKVSKTGKVIALKKGRVTITAIVGNKNYPCNIYVGDYWLSNYNFDDYTSNIINLNKNDDCAVGVRFHMNNTYYDVPLQDVKVVAENEGIIQLEYETYTENGIEYIDSIRINGTTDGKTELYVTIGTMKKTMKVTIGTGTGKLDPIDAIKQENYIGYSNDEVETLKKVVEVINQYNLNSSTLSDEEKIRSTQEYFNQTRLQNPNSNKEGNIANIVFNGHGNLELKEDHAYVQMFGLLCDYMNIPVKYCKGGFLIRVGQQGNGIGYWNKVQLNGTWYYINPFMNAKNNTFTYFLSEELWEDFDLLKEGDFEDFYSTNNTGIKYHLLLSQKEYSYTGYWNVD